MDSSEISELSEDVVQFIRQLISLGIVQDLSKASDDSHPMILSIAGLHISLTGVPVLYPDQLSAFCVPDLSVNSGFYNPYTGRYDNRTPAPDSTVSSKWNDTSAQ